MNNVNQTALGRGAAGLKLFDVSQLKARLVDAKMRRDELDKALAVMRDGPLDKARDAGYTATTLPKVRRWLQDFSDAAEMASTRNQRIKKLREFQEKLEMIQQEIETVRSPEKIKSDSRRRCGEVLGWLSQTPESVQNLIGIFGPKVVAVLNEQQYDDMAEFNAKLASNVSTSENRQPSLPPVPPGFKDFGLTQTDLDDARTDIHLKAERIAALTLENDRQRAQIDQQNSRVREIEAELENGRSAIIQLQSQLAKTEVEKAKLDVELEERERSDRLNFILRGKIEELGEERDSLKQEKADLDELYRELQERFHNLTHEKNEVDAEYEVSRNKLDELRLEKETAEAVSTKAQKDLTRVNKHLTKTLAQAQAAHSLVVQELEDERVSAAKVEEALLEVKSSRDKFSRELTQTRNKLDETLKSKHIVDGELDRSRIKAQQTGADLDQLRRQRTRAIEAFKKERANTNELTLSLAKSHKLTKQEEERADRLRCQLEFQRTANSDIREKLQSATLVLCLSSLASGNDFLDAVIDRVSEEPMIEAPARDGSPVWKVSSFSSDENLRITSGSYSLHSLALDLLVMLSPASLEPNLPHLLNRLCAFQAMLEVEDSECLSCVIDMLLEAIRQIIDHDNLHFVHRVSLYQVALLLGSRWQRRDPLEEIKDKLDVTDQRVRTVVAVLHKWLVTGSLESLGTADDLGIIRFEAYGFVLVGLNKRPEGVLTLYFRDRMLRWVGFECIQRHLDCIIITPSNGGPQQRLMLDAAERLRWARSNLPRREA